MTNSEGATWDVFISYPGSSRPEAEQLYQHLRPLVERIYFAPESNPPGSVLTSELTGAIRSSRVVVALITSESPTATWQQNEISLALHEEMRDMGPRVVAVISSGAEIPLDLLRKTALSVEKEGGFSAVAQRVAELLMPRVLPARTGRLSGPVFYSNILGFWKFPYSFLRDGPIPFFDQQIRLFEEIFGPIFWMNIRGDEFTLFLQHESPKESLINCILFGLHLLNAAKFESDRIGSPEHPFQIAVTVNFEHDAEWRDFQTSSGGGGSASNLMGAEIDRARQTMTVFSDRPYLLISEQVFNVLGGPSFFQRRVFQALKERSTRDSYLLLPEVGSIYQLKQLRVRDLHKVEHTVYSLYIEDSNGRIQVGDNREPQQRVPIEYRTSQNALEQNTFVQRLIMAERVCIVGVTHETLVDFLKFALTYREEMGKSFWETLQIVFPSEHFLETVLDQHDINTPDKGVKARKETWRQGRRLIYQWLLQLPEEHPSRWECLEFSGHLSYVGQRFLNDQNEAIRVAPLLPGADVKDSYYMEVFSGSRVFEQLSNAFDFMINRSKPIAEWNICTTVRGEDICFKGIINRSRRNKAVERLRLVANELPHFPVVLVVLHAELGTRLGILQERTPFNAASDFHKYSNISGSLIDQDILRSLTTDGILPDSPQYNAFVERNYLIVQSNDFNASLDFLEAMGGKIALNSPISQNIMDRAWQLAAVRECYEELGLTIDCNRLVLQNPQVLLRQRHLEHNLVFRIFSLEITRAELENIKTLRPRSNLSEMNWSQLESYYRESLFNHLLQERFNDIFVPIYQNLGVVH